MFRDVRAQRQRRKRTAKLQLSQLVSGGAGGRRVPCLYAEMDSGGGPVYVEISRWQARYLAECLTGALMRDAAYWGDNG